MAETGRLIVVSNRLPVSLERGDGEWSVKRSAGGLATAMDPILKRTGGVWIGWSGASETEPEELLAELRERQGCFPVDISLDLARRFYEGYANQAIWPLFHSFISYLRFEPDSWAAYSDANERFCSAVAEMYQAGDRIWIHDYHLMLLPALLRERIPDAAIGFFLHIPFPASDVFAVLPRSESLLRGLLGADLIGFHTHSYLQHFRHSLRRLLGVESALDRIELSGRDVRIQALPIGIAPEEFAQALESPEATEQLSKIRAQHQDRKIIVAVDRLDYTKGLPARLRTFQRFLKTQPDWKGKVVLFQIAVPTRENIGDYQEIRDEVHALVAKTNGEIGTSDWVPVVYIHHGVERTELAALYQSADVAWVAPLRDGMNLVAKEYLACKPQGDGALILSTFAGAAAEMGEALLVNPWDEERTADTLLQALSMDPAEQAERMMPMRERVLRNDVFNWADSFLKGLDEAAADRANPEVANTPALPAAKFREAFLAAKQRVLLIDYDGTLVPIAGRPQDAAPGARVVELLTALAAQEANRVLVITGRRAADVQRWLGAVPHLGFAPEHGAIWKFPDSTEWHGHPAPPEWQSSVRPILQDLVDRTPGSFIEQKEFALVWHYRLAEPEFAEWMATELLTMLEGMLAGTGLRAYGGKKIVEVKPIWAHKGSIVPEVLREYPGCDFLCGIGDDRTDEDLFAALPEQAWSIFVGDGRTKASYRLRNPAEVTQLLQSLTA